MLATIAFCDYLAWAANLVSVMIWKHFLQKMSCFELSKVFGLAMHSQNLDFGYTKQLFVCCK